MQAQLGRLTEFKSRPFKFLSLTNKAGNPPLFMNEWIQPVNDDYVKLISKEEHYSLMLRYILEIPSLKARYTDKFKSICPSIEWHPPVGITQGVTLDSFLAD